MRKERKLSYCRCGPVQRKKRKKYPLRLPELSGTLSLNTNQAASLSRPEFPIFSRKIQSFRKASLQKSLKLLMKLQR
jgi:hypothetical protein